jgi:hypothetical protein
MDRPGDSEPIRPEPEVSLADAGIAAEIARAAARGRGADRTPTLEQLLAAFGEPVPTDAARRRVAAALEVAGMGVRPDLRKADAGQRLLLLPPGASAGPGRTRALMGLLAVAAVLIVAAGAAALLGGGDDRASDSLPAAETTRFTPPARTDVAAATDTTGTSDTTDTTGTTGSTDTTAATATDTVATTATQPAGTTTATTTTEDGAASDEQGAAERRRRRKAREREARRQRAAAERRRTVAVVVDASARPTFLCVEDGEGHQLFGGTLSGRQTFRARRVRLNVGLSSTVVTVDGNPVRLSGSPAGLDITRRGGAQDLPPGQRPCG